MEFCEHKMFTNQSSFPHSSSNYSPIFTDPSIALFPGSSTKNSKSLDDLSTATSVLHDPTNDRPTISYTPECSQEPRHSNRVRAPLVHFQDYHCFSAREASVNPL